MPIQGTLTVSHYIAAQRLHYWLRPWAIAFFLLCALVLVWIGSAWQEWVVAAFAIYMVVALAIIAPFRGRSHFRQNKALAEPMCVEVREDGVFFSSAHSGGLLPWGHIHKVRADSRTALIYRTANMFHIVPRGFFSNDSEYQAFVKTLEEKGAHAAT